MTFAQLRVLVAVAERGGFTSAAELVGMSQPAVSRAVAALEAELGAPLLSRARDGVRLTQAGERALVHARETLRHAALIREEVAAMRDDVRGQLIVASFPTATARLLPSVLGRYRERYPQVQVRLLEGTDQEARRWLDQRAADIAVVLLPAHGVETFPLTQDEMVAVVPAQHRLADHGTVSLDNLVGEPFILSTGGCEQLIRTAARRTGAKLRPSFEVREVATILAMVEAGLGVSVVPTLALLGNSHAVATLPLSPRLSRSLALALPADANTTTPAARAFVALATNDGQAAGRPASAKRQGPKPTRSSL